ncbi:MAG: tetratricopeptide repeat-containing sensor histidine kinase [Bacteroidales bacterium]
MKLFGINIVIKKKYINKQLLIIFTFANIGLYSQTKIDSLKNQLKDHQGNNKIELLYQLSSKYLEISPDSAIKYANQGLLLVTTNNRKLDFIYLLASSYKQLNNFKQAINFLQQSYEGYKALNNNRKLIDISNDIGVAYARTFLYSDALLYFQKSLLLSYEIKDTAKIASTMSNIGMTYYKMKEYKLALNNYEKILALNSNHLPIYELANTMNRISVVYGELQNYQLALKYQKISLEIYKKLDSKIDIAYVMSNISESYKRLNDIDIALKYLKSAYVISENLGDENINLVILSNIGDLFVIKKNYNKAFEYLNIAEKRASKLGDKDIIKDIYEILSRYYALTNNYQKAYEYSKLFKQENDSVYSKESRDKVTELQIKFDILEKDKENKILQQKTEIQRLAINKQIYLRNTFIYFSIIILLLVVILFYRFWLNKKANKMLKEKNEFIFKQNNELEEVYNTKDKLFAIITHDLKNPFNTIVTLTGFVEENYYTIEDTHKYSCIQSLRRSVINVSELLENLTDWLNAKSDKMILHKTNFNIHFTIQSVMNLYITAAEQKSIHIQLHVDSKLYVFGNERLIKTVIRNLIDNALKFTLEGGKIDLKTKIEEDRIVVSVADTGVGIEETDKGKIFNLVTHISTKGTRHETGGGLGLILSKEFVEKNDGEIWFKSKAGKGSTFYFSIMKGVDIEKD